MIVCDTAAAKSNAPDGMMIEFLQGPIVNGITDATPEFSWIVHSSQKNDMQSAYHILISSNRQMLAENKADMWDSKKRDSANSINVSYSGKTLQPNTSYYWKVNTWCTLDGESEWSETMKFSTGSIGNEYVTTRYPIRQTAVSPSEIIKKSDGHYLIDFGKVAFGYLHLELNAHGDGHQMEVHLGERGDANGVNKNPGGTVRYYKIMRSLTSGVNKLDIHPPADQRNTGEKAIRLLEEFGSIIPFRYVELVNCPAELNESMIQQISVHYPFDESASAFESSDPVLNDIWALCKYSMKATSFCGVYVDGDRERIPYEADAYINQLSHYAVDREYTLARYSHEYLLKHPTWPTEWKQHSVLMAWTDFMYTGNTESLAQNYEVLKSKTLENRAREDGLLNTEGMRDIVDWPSGERDGYEFKEVNTVVNAFYYKTLIQMADIAAVLGKETDAAEYQKKAVNVKLMFNKVFFDTQRGVYLDGENTKHASLHANMMPLAFGLVPEDRRKTVVDFVVSRGMACSVYGAQYLLEALYEGGRPEVAIERMTSKDIRSWYNMLRMGSTITLEAWDNKFKPNQDWNHAWGAVPGNIIPRYLLGVRPLEAGFGKVLIRPMPGSLATVNATIPTIRGPIGVKIVNNPGKPFILELSIPVNMTARVEIPLPGGKGEITLDDKAVPSKKVRGFALVENVGSGIHTFRTDEVVKARVKQEIYP
jgi:alpha-L-rhamnosidase